MADEIYLTKEGRNKLISELERLQKRRPEITNEIERARELGDLKENAEYHAAKEALTNLAKRTVEIQNKLSRARILDEDNINKEKVYIGVTVHLKDINEGDEFNYKIVDLEEANPMEGKISVQSPMAQGLLGAKVGDTVKINLPNSVLEVKILKIS